MNTNTPTPHTAGETTKVAAAKASKGKKLAKLNLAKKTLNEGSIVVAPEGHKEDFDNRVYACLNAKAGAAKDEVCGNRGSVNGGAFHRDHSDTICNECGSHNNRWEREALV